MREGLRLGGRLVWCEDVSGRPFRAKYFLSDVNSTQSVTGSIARDSAGNTRIDTEYPYPPGPATAAIIRSIASQELIFLDVTHKLILTRTPFVTSGGEWRIGNLIYTDTFRDIEGLRCRLVRFRRPGDREARANPGELWWSEDLKQTVLDNPTGRHITYRLFDVVVGEPPSELFFIPADFLPAETGRAVFDPSLEF